LGIETSCDETGVALVRAFRPSDPAKAALAARGEILAQALHSQVALHAAYGGVVPELASRDHVLRLIPLIEQVMAQAGVDWPQIDAIAYTEGPGLAGALLVGASTAQGIAMASQRPVMGIHHLEGHLLSPLLDPSAAGITLPFLALLVSGGHTQIMRVDGLGHYALLGETIDDAAGEAFDKSAQLLGLGYPGGPEIGQWAAKGSAERFALPRPLIKRPTLDFSFAGLKTAVLTQTQKIKAERHDGELSDQDRADMAASVQSAIVDVLMAKCERAMAESGLKTLVIAGGVGANQELRARLAELAKKRGLHVCFPAPALCTDNGAMIAWASALKLLAGLPPSQAGSFSVSPRWPLAQAAG
jgi:N6-L-threonylcarbamoyladenine synthase